MKIKEKINKEKVRKRLKEKQKKKENKKKKNNNKKKENNVKLKKNKRKINKKEKGENNNELTNNTLPKEVSLQVIDVEKKLKRKKLKKRIIICIVIILIIILVMFLISLYKWNKIIKDILVCENSIILDSTGNEIAVLGEQRIHKKVSLDEIPEDLINAYVSIEDKNFYKHNGINLKRTIGATISYIKNGGSSSFGGSTITQQLVKNITGENEATVFRKINEWDKAIKTEMVLTKDEILEAYLNIIYVAPNVYGVEMGAEYYFDKNVTDLDLAECAYLAGINHSPNSYNPFYDEIDNSEEIKDRTETVLNVMLEEGYIKKSEYRDAIEEVENGLSFKKGDVKPDGDAVYSYMADATISRVISDLEKEKNMSKTFATNYLYWAGLTIYSTQDSDIQEKTENECKKDKYMLKSTINKEATTQAAMVIIDHTNGQVVACVGGLGEKDTSRGFNRATQALRQTGSAIKPIAVLGPALEEDIITPLTIYNDTLTTFDGNYTPEDCENELGKITVRRAVESSQNIPFVKMMEELGTKKSIKYLKNQGITTLTEGDNNLSLALGGLEKGISPLEMAAAYATIANDGVYIEPIFYTKIEDANGNVIIEPKQKNKVVYSEDTAYVLKELLTQPVEGEKGTAKTCKIDGFEVAAKTGTTNDNYDKWLCGFTKYYTAATWFGFDYNETINEGADSMATQIWSNVMNNIHKDLIKADFDVCDSVEQVEICRETGKIANSSCNDTYIEYFKRNNITHDICGEEHTKTKKKNDDTNGDYKNKKKNI